MGGISLIPYTEIHTMYELKEIPKQYRKYLTSRIDLLDTIEYNFMASEMKKNTNTKGKK